VDFNRANQVREQVGQRSEAWMIAIDAEDCLEQGGHRHRKEVRLGIEAWCATEADGL
jgi:hypothetical protein